MEGSGSFVVVWAPWPRLSETRHDHGTWHGPSWGRADITVVVTLAEDGCFLISQHLMILGCEEHSPVPGLRLWLLG